MFSLLKSDLCSLAQADPLWKGILPTPVSRSYLQRFEGRESLKCPLRQDGEGVGRCVACSFIFWVSREGDERAEQTKR